MNRFVSACIASLLVTAHALAASAPAEAAEPGHVGTFGIVVFVLIFVGLTVGMFAAPFLHKRGKGADGDQPH